MFSSLLLVQLLGCLAAGAMFGVDVFAAAVITPALRAVDDRSLTMAMGSFHELANSRMPPLFVITAGSAIGALFLGATPLWVGAGLAATVAWMVLLGLRVLPLNNRLRKAHAEDAVPEDVREIQGSWDRLLAPRLVLLLVAFVSYLLALVA